MTALAQDRKTDEMQIFDSISPLEYGVAASTKCYAGGLACLNSSGYLVPGSTSTTLIAVGAFEKQVDNSAGANGDVTARAKPGVYKFVNSGNSIAVANIGALCYIVDDQTVALTDGTGTRSKAGKIVNVDSSGVWVAVGFELFVGI